MVASFPEIASLHPAVSSWFVETLGAPTAPQRAAWPKLAGGNDVLVAAPTGSGKTLAAFLVALDELVKEAEAGTLGDEVRVVYVSPLKALSNDVHKNLMVPLEGICARLAAHTSDRAVAAPIELRAAVRTGDTPAKERAQVMKRPPHVLVTTPESLYVLLGSAGGRKLLGTARTVILDEIHAVANTRRGAHLALSVERLEREVAKHGHTLQRIGLSATQKPVDEVARFLVGAARCTTGPDAVTPRCDIVDAGHMRAIDVDVEIPKSPLEAVMSGEVWSEVFARIADLATEHKTTLVFVNTRKLAERVSAQLDTLLKERLGPNLVGAHHGSMSKDKRFDAEQRLKTGQLRVLVATASLELGIDVGAVELVCQIGVTKSIAALLQRVGRANHTTTGVPKGRLFPLSRDELVEACALVDAIKNRDLDALIIPTGGLDVLAQQLVATVGDEEVHRAELMAMAQRAWPYRALTTEQFDDVLELVHEGVRTQRGRRGAHVYVDNTTGMVRGRKGARLAALTSGGAIPDQGDYVVVEEPQGTVVGTINEDFAIESMAGDVFQLGTTSWRILRVERGTVRVEDAKGQPPSIPFWLGEAPARTPELSERISSLREIVTARLEEGADVSDIVAFLVDERGMQPAAARQIGEYLCAVFSSLGTIPTTKRVVFERFHDDLGGSQIVVHAPFGGRITRAWGLALRKRFCRSFDFELQAAATEDALLLSVGAVQGVDLTALPKFLTSKTVRGVLVQALLDAPMFGTRFRWNATRALTMLRMRGGKRIPPGLQRIEAEDLLVSLFPEQVACVENIVGDREIPDEVLIQQTLADCMTEAMDIDGLERVLTDIEHGRIEVRCVDTTQPSALAHEILAAKPYAYLDDAPLEERRVQAVFVPRGLDGQGAPLDPAIVADVLAEIHAPVSSLDEAHDVLGLCGFLFEPELHTVGGPNMPALVDELTARGRAERVAVGKKGAVIAAERAARIAEMRSDFDALVDILRGRLEVHGPRAVADVVRELGVDAAHATAALERLEKTGEALRGKFGVPVVHVGSGVDVVHRSADDDARGAEQVWAKRLVTRVRRRMLEKLRAEIQPVHPRDLMRFLLAWQRLDAQAGDVRAQGIDGLWSVLERLAGVTVPAAAWEEEVLARRIEGYDASFLDQLCFAGRVAWTRMDAPGGVQSGARSLRSSAIAVMPRELVATFVPSAVDESELSSGAVAMLAHLRARGASFFADLKSATGLLPEPAEHALAELVSAGLVTSDGFAGLRALLLSAKDREKVRRRTRGRSGLVPGASLDAGGRWSVVPNASTSDANASEANVATRAEPRVETRKSGARTIAEEERAEAQARALLRRWGVVFRKLAERDGGLVPWRDILFALRRLEARGEVRGGRFVHGFAGEQFALPDVVTQLRAARKQSGDPRHVVISAADPMNLTGVVLPGARVPAVLGHRILYEDGMLVAVLDAQGVRVVDDTRLDMGEIDALLRRNPGRTRFTRAGSAAVRTPRASARKAE